MKIKINHIGYTVTIKKRQDFLKSERYDSSFDRCPCVCERADSNNSIIYIDNPKKNIVSLAHEVLHVIQYICSDRHIDFIDEKEHCAYMLHYILNTIIGDEYDI